MENYKVTYLHCHTGKIYYIVYKQTKQTNK